MPLLLAGVVAATVLGVGFPASTLWAQHRQLGAATAQLASLQGENRVLAEQQRQLGSNVEIARLARADYQLIPRGQTLFDILPPAGQTSTAAPGSSMTGDPANQALVPPASAPSMTPDPGLPTAPSSGAASSSAGGGVTNPASAGSSFWSRIANTLEFWK